MNNTNETSSAVLAEMRGNEFDDPHLSAEGMLGVRRLARNWADRIEAAVKREREAIEAAALSVGGFVEAARHRPGNMAAMREACQKTLDLLMLRGDGKARCVLTWDEFNESQKMLRTALAAPARNCNRFNSGDPTKDVADAYAEWQRHCDDLSMPPSCKVESAFRQWLFAPMKGDAKDE